MNNVLNTTILSNFSRYKITTELCHITNKLIIDFILAGATFSDTASNITEFLRLKNEEQLPYSTIIKNETIRDRLYRNVYVLFGNNIQLRVGSLPVVDIEDNTFSDLFAQLFSSYLTEDNIFNINSFINELDVSSEQWNSQSVLLKMNISIDIEEDVNRVDEVRDLEEESAPILIPEAKILTDQDTINILKIFTLTHFLENALYRYTAKAMIEEQQR